MTVLPEPDDSMIQFMEQLLAMVLLNSGYTIEQTLDVYNYQFKFETEDEVLDETFKTIDKAIFCRETEDTTIEKLQRYGFSVKHCMRLEESNARLYMRDYIRNSILLDTSDFKEIFLLCTAAALYYKSASCNRKELLYVVTSEWARFLAGIPLPESSSVFFFLKELCDLYVSWCEVGRKAGTTQ